MADISDQLSEKHIAFIKAQHLFFVATAPVDGRVNLSPKGIDSLRVLDPSSILWMNLTGSGNETAGHLLQNSRMTLMLCSFDRQPLIMRIYGVAVAIHEFDSEWSTCVELFPEQLGTRQFFRLAIDTVQTSCGYGVPLYEYTGERQTLIKWAENKGPDEIRAYWADRNQTTIDGDPTGILRDN